MSASYRIIAAEDMSSRDRELQAFALDVLIGLSEKPRHLKSKYFYDETGSKLFQQIMTMPEYYLTGAETEIFTTQREQISSALGGTPFNLVELGAGDGVKTRILIEQFLRDRQKFEYVPVDISESAMSGLCDTISTSFPELVMSGLVAEYFDALKYLSSLTDKRTVVFFLGSNLGNFYRAETRVFLRSLWNTLRDGDMVMIGFDLKKDIELMLSAYNDPAGITAAFNLNLLRRINRELGGNFNLEKFRFYSTYNVFSGAIESYLVSLVPQEVFIRDIGQKFDFRAWEPIHTEYSYKYLESDIHSLASATGYRVAHQFHDQPRRFVDSVWRVEKEDSRSQAGEPPPAEVNLCSRHCFT